MIKRVEKMKFIGPIIFMVAFIATGITLEAYVTKDPAFFAFYGAVSVIIYDLAGGI